LKADATNPDAAINYARALVALGELNDAALVVKDGLAANPEHASLLNASAAVLRQQKKFEAAAEAARKVLLRDQKNVAAIKSLALIYADQGKLELAETFFRN